MWKRKKNILYIVLLWHHSFILSIHNKFMTLLICYELNHKIVILWTFLKSKLSHISLIYINFFFNIAKFIEVQNSTRDLYRKKKTYSRPPKSMKPLIYINGHLKKHLVRVTTHLMFHYHQPMGPLIKCKPYRIMVTHASQNFDIWHFLRISRILYISYLFYFLTN